MYGSDAKGMEQLVLTSRCDRQASHTPKTCFSSVLMDHLVKMSSDFIDGTHALFSSNFIMSAGANFSMNIMDL